jgi:hypothetical protein
MFLKLFPESKRNRAATEQLGRHAFQNVARVSKLLASSVSMDIKGAPFVLTEALPDTYSPLSLEGLNEFASEAVVRHFLRRTRPQDGIVLTTPVAAISFQQILEKRFKGTDFIHHHMQENARELAALSSDLFGVFCNALQCITPTREVLFQHGEFSPANVFYDAEGNLGLVDFELAGWGDFAYDFYAWCNRLLDKSDTLTSQVARMFRMLGGEVPRVLDHHAWRVWSVGRWFDISYYWMTTTLTGAHRKEVLIHIAQRGQKLVDRITHPPF